MGFQPWERIVGKDGFFFPIKKEPPGGGSIGEL